MLKNICFIRCSNLQTWWLLRFFGGFFVVVFFCFFLHPTDYIRHDIQVIQNLAEWARMFPLPASEGKTRINTSVSTCTWKKIANISSGRSPLKSSLVPLLRVPKTPFVEAIWLHLTYLIMATISPGRYWILQCWTHKIQLERVLGHHDQAMLLSRMTGPEDPWGPFQPGILCFYLHPTTLISPPHL